MQVYELLQMVGGSAATGSATEPNTTQWMRAAITPQRVAEIRHASMEEIAGELSRHVCFVDQGRAGTAELPHCHWWRLQHQAACNALGCFLEGYSTNTCSVAHSTQQRRSAGTLCPTLAAPVHIHIVQITLYIVPVRVFAVLALVALGFSCPAVPLPCSSTALLSCCPAVPLHCHLAALLACWHCLPLLPAAKLHALTMRLSHMLHMHSSRLNLLSSKLEDVIFEYGEMGMLLHVAADRRNLEIGVLKLETLQRQEPPEGV